MESADQQLYFVFIGTARFQAGAILETEKILSVDVRYELLDSFHINNRRAVDALKQ